MLQKIFDNSVDITDVLIHLVLLEEYLGLVPDRVPLYTGVMVEQSLSSPTLHARENCIA